MRKRDGMHVSREYAIEQTSERDSIEVTIERILPGGLGLAHFDDRTVMVALAAPGDRLRASIDRLKGGVAFASIIEILEASPVRVEPPCPYFGRCGGCDFQQLNYQAQLEAKVAIIRDCLRRIARIEEVPEFDIVTAPNEWHYRARAQWQYDSVRRRLGYFEANSHHVCDVAECAVLVPELQRKLEDLRGHMQRSELPDDARHFRAVVGDDFVSVAAGTGGTHGVRNPIVREGAGEITRRVGGESYRLSAQSFFQANVDLLPRLIDYALGGVRGHTAIELYCGVGLFTVPLARHFEYVIAVEDDADATEFARQNLASADLHNALIVNGDVADWVEEHLECAGFDGALDRGLGGGSKAASTPRSAAALQIDFLLLDPPRTGAESRVISGMLKLKPKHICYVSCDPATLARDLRKLIAGGYAVEGIAAFDMFPQTHHVETVVHLVI